MTLVISLMWFQEGVLFTFTVQHFIILHMYYFLLIIQNCMSNIN